MPKELQCVCCGIAVDWEPTIVDGKTYCCAGCAEGGPCRCDYDDLPERGKIKAMVHSKVAGLTPLKGEGS